MAETPHDHDRDREREVVTDRERTTHVTERVRGGGTGIAAVVGGLVVAVLLMFWLFSSGGNEAEISQTDVTVEETETAGDSGAATEEMVGTGAEAESEPAAEAAPEPAGEAGGEETQAAEEPPADEAETAN